MRRLLQETVFIESSFLPINYSGLCNSDLNKVEQLHNI